jgi:hypothetical protein
VRKDERKERISSYFDSKGNKKKGNVLGREYSTRTRRANHVTLPPTVGLCIIRFIDPSALPRRKRGEKKEKRRTSVSVTATTSPVENDISSGDEAV